jgi:hypothetical protein
MEGRGARLAAGAARLAYAGSLYGEAPQLAEPLTRRGADVGVALAGFRFFRAVSPERRAVAGWWLVISAGLNIGVPILSDLGAFELADASLGEHPLTDAEVARIEAALAAAPDRAWRRGVAQRLLSG